MVGRGTSGKNTPEGKNASERGRELYAAKDYQGAADAFSEAIKGSTQYLLFNALDNRAACFEKLERYKAALRDAKRIIELSPTSSKGYLRCGKVLQMTGNTQLAMQIYERGLSKVKISISEPNRVKMQENYNKLKRAMKPDRTLDPLHHLPPEVAVMVCHQLSMRDRVICLAVSRGWKSFLEALPELWTELDTSYCQKRMRLFALKIHLRRSKYTLDSALVTMKAKYDVQSMRFLTRMCKELRELRIHGQGLIGESLSASVPLALNLKLLHVSPLTEVSIGTVQSCLRTCKKIEDMKFGKVQGSVGTMRDDAWTNSMNESIKRLELRSNKKSLLDIDNLVPKTPNLISAVLVDWKVNPRMLPIFNLEGWTHLEYLDLTNTQILVFPKLPETLKHLTLANNPRLAIPDVATLLSLTTLPLLETFNCHQTALNADQIKFLVGDAVINGNLKRLSVGARSNLADDSPADEEFPRSESVEELSLAMLLLDDKRCLDVVALYPNLRRLDVSGTNITGVAIRDFVKRGIISLKLDECSEISPDAVEWARGEGVQASYNFPSRSGPPKFANSAFANSL